MEQYPNFVVEELVTQKRLILAENKQLKAENKKMKLDSNAHKKNHTCIKKKKTEKLFFEKETAQKYVCKKNMEMVLKQVDDHISPYGNYEFFNSFTEKNWK